MKDGHKPGQDQDLLAHWGRLLKEKSGSGSKTPQLDLRKGEHPPPTESQSILKKRKMVVGMRLDFSQSMRNPAFIRLERDSCVLGKQNW